MSDLADGAPAVAALAVVVRVAGDATRAAGVRDRVSPTGPGTAKVVRVVADAGAAEAVVKTAAVAVAVVGTAEAVVPHATTIDDS
mgnify:CR=1 FL=1